MAPTVLVTGGSGFVGRRVVRELRRQAVGLRVLRHRSPVPGTDGGLQTVTADLADPGTLPGVCEGVDVLVHCAAQIGGSEAANHAVNARGTAALVAEARRAGVGRIVHLSTASVYGRGVYRGSRPEELERRPSSATSRSRALAEDAVLAAGGVVLRPHLVYGDGDSWVGPGLARILRALPGTVDGWPARTTMIDVRDLARLLVGAALAPAAGAGLVHHAGHPEPVAVHTLLRAVAGAAAIPWPDRGITGAQARAALAADGLDPARLELLTADHVFESARLWTALGLEPGSRFEDGFRRAAPWYCELLAPARL
ncbi:NAD(P)-dependent oxidoreductase [Streptomyces sp. TLI_171]|uniref:NAD-dependent epimerase/dehydratase family protein n=1 Tax=Streptomyces sp. TLI_171 TaxID=1938859 RepID=UPI000C17E650|nr:NAD(P)-dependent oxidoreductase [Streptomyces sp. TLI_171]RKE19902.1 nucleoside-diphosphate-sugar epimerase [Streptomyces sp. TLI_171]